jgi:hypothetical protein
MIFWQEPPAAISYQEEAHALARLTIATGACNRDLGYVVNEAANREEVAAYARRRTAQGIDPEMSRIAYFDALDRETARWDEATRMHPTHSETESRAQMMRIAQFIVDLCAEASRPYPRVITASSDGPVSAPDLLELWTSER